MRFKGLPDGASLLDRSGLPCVVLKWDVLLVLLLLLFDGLFGGALEVRNPWRAMSSFIFTTDR